jgi:hypothetical protein
MPGKVTYKFRQNNARQFYESVGEASPTNLYVFLARTNAWTTDSSPPTPVDSVKQTNYDVWRNMIAAKKVSTSDLTFAVPRTNWANNTFYTKYTDSNGTLFSNNFFVVTDTYNVYKCIDNNGNANSTVKPTTTTSSTVLLSDGYKWKYMYTIGAADALKFLTTNYMPVKTLTANDGSSQWTVQQAAANGSIETVVVTAGGASYFTHSGSFQQVSNSSVLRLAAGASGNDDFYVGSTLYIPSGLGSGQIREIVDYDGTTKDATVNNGFTVTPNTSSTYFAGPKVTIGGDGRNALAYANTTSGAINKVILINNGNNYSYAPVTFSANLGAGATADAYVSPQGGHGSDPVEELGGYNVMLNVKMTGTESNTFIVNNDFRVIGILADPVLANGSIANSSVYDMTTKLTLTSISGTYQYDEVINGGTSGHTARVVAFANTNASGTTGVLSLTGVSGTFATSETITGNTSSVTATVSSVDAADLRPYAGDVLFIENRPPVSRASDQTEDIKLVIKY